MCRVDIPDIVSSTSRESTSHPPQQSRALRTPFPSRISQSWNPLPRYFTTASAIEPPQDVTSSSSTPPSSSPADGTDFLPSDTMTNQFKNFYRMATGSMTPAGQEAYWEDADRRYATIDCNRCESQRDYLLQFSPIIRYMRENISRLGGSLDRSNIRCRTCTKGMLGSSTAGMQGGLDHQYGVILCANRVEKRSMLEDVLAHEMVHAYDHLRFKTNLDAETPLRQIACSEIRASNLSGECRWANEFFRNKQLSFTSHHQDCVRRRAVLSVRNRPNCKSDLEAVEAVNEVWDSCFRDTRPFDEIFR